jgi:hypothetical protein
MAELWQEAREGEGMLAEIDEIRAQLKQTSGDVERSQQQNRNASVADDLKEALRKT